MRARCAIVGLLLRCTALIIKRTASCSESGRKVNKRIRAVMYSGNPDTVRPCPHNLGGNSADWTTSLSSPGFGHSLHGVVGSTKLLNMNP